jgi:hypothetical protein
MSNTQNPPPKRRRLPTSFILSKPIPHDRSDKSSPILTFSTSPHFNTSSKTQTPPTQLTPNLLRKQPAFIQHAQPHPSSPISSPDSIIIPLTPQHIFSSSTTPTTPVVVIASPKITTTTTTITQPQHFIQIGNLTKIFLEKKCIMLDCYQLGTPAYCERHQHAIEFFTIRQIPRTQTLGLFYNSSNPVQPFQPIQGLLYTGNIVTLNQLNHLQSKYHAEVIQLDSNVFLELTTPDIHRWSTEFAKYIAHSPNPNASIRLMQDKLSNKTQCLIYSTKIIRQHDQITIDFGKQYKKQPIRPDYTFILPHQTHNTTNQTPYPT